MCLHCETGEVIHPFALCQECLVDITWVERGTLCSRCGRSQCCCCRCFFHGSIKPAFIQDGTISFLLEASEQGRIRASRALSQLLQGWELIRYVSTFVPLEQKDAQLASALNHRSNPKTNLEATVTHILTNKKRQLLPFTLKNKLLIPLVDIH